MSVTEKNSIYSELRKRRVFRTLAVYVALAWASIEILLTVFDRLGAPQWIGTSLVIVFIAGFPLAVLLAWLFDIQDGRIRRVATGRVSALIGVLSVATVASAGVAITLYLQPNADGPAAAVVFDDIRRRPLTATDGYEFYPALSPDGNVVAYAHASPTEPVSDIYLLEIASGQSTRIERPDSADQWPVWSGDGTRIAYISGSPPSADSPGEKIMIRSVVTGSDALLTNLRGLGIERIANLDWSADGQWLAINGSPPEERSAQIYLISALDGSTTQATPTNQGHFDFAARFSPDSTRVAFIRQVFQGGRRICVYDVATTEVRCVTPDNEEWQVAHIAWLNERTLLAPLGFVAGARQLVQVDTESAQLKLAPFGADAEYIATSRRGNRLVYEELFVDHSLWRYPGPASVDRDFEPSRLINSTGDEGGPTYSPDGQSIAYMSNQSGAWEIWVARADGSQSRRITNFGFANFPNWAPDSSSLVVSSFIAPGSPQAVRLDNATSKLYAVDKLGGIPRLMVGDEAVNSLAGSYDSTGDSVLYVRSPGSTCPFDVWRHDLTSAAAELVAPCLLRPEVGSDGRIYVLTPDGDVASLAADGSDQRVELRYHSDGICTAHNSGWTIWRDNVVYLDCRDLSIRFKNKATGETELLAMVDQPIPLDQIPNSTPQLAVSPDGQWVIYNRIDRAGSDLVMIEWGEPVR
ncbi:MAG: hypothetical protein AAGC71_00245 [Pseudomonadota bacterium]